MEQAIGLEEKQTQRSSEATQCVDITTWFASPSGHGEATVTTHHPVTQPNPDQTTCQSSTLTQYV